MGIGEWEIDGLLMRLEHLFFLLIMLGELFIFGFLFNLMLDQRLRGDVVGLQLLWIVR